LLPGILGKVERILGPSWKKRNMDRQDEQDGDEEVALPLEISPSLFVGVLYAMKLGGLRILADERIPPP
jgi:hypothetical protein